jgi:uncharacterized protein
MAKQVLFVQGGAEGAYKDDARLAESLRSNLGPNYQVRYPAMPNEADPDYQSWKRSILRGVQEMGEGAILVGHSIGASVLIRMLADRVPRPSIAGVFLIAGPFWHDHEFGAGMKWRCRTTRPTTTRAMFLCFFITATKMRSFPFLI